MVFHGWDMKTKVCWYVHNVPLTREPSAVLSTIACLGRPIYLTINPPRMPSGEGVLIREGERYFALFGPEY